MSSEDFIQIIDELGRRLEGPAKHVFQLAVRQVYVDLFTSATAFLVLLVASLFIWRHVTQVIREEGDIIDANPVEVFGGFIVGVFLVVTFGFLMSNIAGALNPEWRAIHMIAETIVP